MLTNHGRDARHAHLDAALGGDFVRHEREVAALAVPELGGHAKPVQAADDTVADPDLAELPAHRGTVGAGDDDGVHALPRHGNPAPLHAHVGPHVGGRVEVVWNRAVPVRDSQQSVPLLDGVTAERYQLLDQAPQAGVGVRRHPHLQLRELVVGAADLEMQHLELSAALDDGIEDRVEELRVDQVALRLDDYGVLRCIGHDWKLDYSHGWHGQHGMRRHDGAVVSIRAAAARWLECPR